MEETHFAYWLSTRQAIGNITLNKLLDLAGSYEAIWHLTEKELSSPTLNLSQRQIQSLLADKDEEIIIRAYTSMESDDIHFVYANHPLFPNKLKYISDSPIGLFYRGTLPNPDILSIAIVGARACSEYGRYISRKLGTALAQSGIQIISGMAKGVDGIAQKGALDVRGYSCGVLGCGVDICYPQENKPVYEQLINTGCVMSEYAPSTPPKSHQFPRRNRIISALSDIVVVVEAKEKSGSLITADIALEQGKDVYAVPGRVTDSLSHGTNRLIRQGAGLILSPEEFIQDISVNYTYSKGPLVDDEIYQMSLGALGVNMDSEKRILSVLGLDPKNINKIQEETGLDTGTLMNGIMKLSMRGFILQNGSYYTRCV